MTINIIQWDVLKTLQSFPDNSFDAVLSDPPYALNFMGKDWDAALPSVQVWQELLRVIKPGAYIAIFGGSRTFFQLGFDIKQAGFEIKDTLCWLHGQGFPKGMNISKAIDKAQGVKPKVIGEINKTQSYGHQGNNCYGSDIERNGKMKITAPATDEAQEWEGYSTCLKPSFEPVILAQKPLEGTYAHNCLKWGCGALNIDGCRIGDNPGYKYNADKNGKTFHGEKYSKDKKGDQFIESTKGRYPANTILDESSAAMLDQQSGQSKSRGSDYNWTESNNDNPCNIVNNIKSGRHYEDEGGASRFFYCAKASKKERNAGLDNLPDSFLKTMNDGIGEREHNPDQPGAWVKNNHPCCKPFDLCRYLATLIMPPKERKILIPYSGSGSEMVGAMLAGFNEITGIEFDAHYCELAEGRINGFKQS